MKGSRHDPKTVFGTSGNRRRFNLPNQGREDGLVPTQMSNFMVTLRNTIGKSRMDVRLFRGSLFAFRSFFTSLVRHSLFGMRHSLFVFRSIFNLLLWVTGFGLVWLGFSVLNAAAGTTAGEWGEELSLTAGMDIAVANNPELAIQRDQVEIARQDANRAKSYLLPQVGGNSRYLQVDRDSAEASFGAQPERQTSIGVKAQQMIYDDQIVSNYRAALRLHQGREFDLDSVRLDVMQQAALRYLDFLAARALARIERENLKLTESNLEVARLRSRVGVGEPQEVYRWEANRASQEAALLSAEARTEQARVALNRALGVDQGRRWRPEEIQVADDQRYFFDPRMRPLLMTGDQQEAFRAFAVDLAFTDQPVLKALERAIEAQRILLGQQRRRFLLPSFSTGFQIDHRLDSDTVTPFSGSSLGSQLLSSDSLIETDDDQWAWSVTASLPLFEGGRRSYDVARSRAEIRRLENSRTQIKQAIEQGVRAALYGIDGSQPGVRLARQALASADKNLEVVRDQYARGVVPIITLLDAQNRAFSAAQQVVIARTSYLDDLIKFQRAIAWFETSKTDQERRELVERFRAYLGR